MSFGGTGGDSSMGRPLSNSPDSIARLCRPMVLASGRLNTVMSNTRLKGFADVPAIGELGYGRDLEVQAWQGVLVRSGTPPAIVDTLYKAIAKAMALDDTKQRIETMAVEPMATDPAAFEAFFASEVKRWTEVAHEAGIQAQ